MREDGKKMKLPAQPVASTSTTKPQSTGQALCGVVVIKN
jgi:BRCT domain type II-containing protein